MASEVFGPRSWPVSGFFAERFEPVHVAVLPTQPGTYSAGAADCTHLSGRKLPLCRSASCCGIGVDEADAVVDRPVGLHLPVVLHVGFAVVVLERPLDVLGRLHEGAEAPDRRVGESEGRVERIDPDGVLGEVDGPEVGAAEDVVLPLQAVVVVEPGLERVAAHDLRQVDRDVLRRVDVEEAGVDDVRRRRTRELPCYATIRFPQVNAGTLKIRVPSQYGGFWNWRIS